MDIRFIPKPHFVRWTKPRRNLRALCSVLFVNRKFRPDLVPSPSTKAGYATRLSCLLLRKLAIFIAHARDPEPLAQATLRVTKLPKEIQQEFGKAVRKLVEDNLSLARGVDVREPLYQGFPKQRRRK